MQAAPSVLPVRSTEAAIAGRAFGAMLFAVFGAILLEVWDRRADEGAAMFIGIAVLGFALLVSAWLVYREHAQALAAEDLTPERKRANRIFHLVNGGQWLLIVVLGNVLSNTGLGAWVVPMAIVVIGLHFVPLAHVFHNPPHYVTAAALVVFALAYPFLAAGGPADPVGFLGTGLILWLSACWALRRGA
jgi:MFS family permease